MVFLMKIGEIKRGTKMAVFKDVDNRATGSAYEAEFRHEESDTTFVVNSLQLYNNYDKLVYQTKFIVAFEVGPMIYTFSARLKEKQRAPFLVEIELLGKVKAFNRRKLERDEILFKVNIYNLPPDYMKATEFSSLANNPILSDTTFDISTGGMCVISNTMLKSKYEPFFLVELIIAAGVVFHIPAKLVRRENYSRTVIGKYDYGFQFLFEHIPNEQNRLMSAIMEKKLST